MQQVFKQIANDLKITRYKGESEQKYASRLAYSSLGIWSRYISATSEESIAANVGNITKNKMHRRIAELIDNYVSISEGLFDFFYEDDCNPANIIRDTLAKSTDLVEVGFESRISTSEPKLCDFGHNDSCFLIGYISLSDICSVSGLSNFVPKEFPYPYSDYNSRKLFGIPELTACEFVKSYFEKINFDFTEDPMEYEFFDPLKDGVISSCWVSYSDYLPKDYCVIRKPSAFGKPTYKAAKIIADTMYTSRLSTFSENDVVRDAQRMIYGIKAINRKPYPVRKSTKDKYTIWSFYSKLPPQEESLLRYIAWPLENINNRKQQYVINNELNLLVEAIVANLGIKVEEE